MTVLHYVVGIVLLPGWCVIFAFLWRTLSKGTDWSTRVTIVFLGLLPIGLVVITALGWPWAVTISGAFYWDLPRAILPGCALIVWAGHVVGRLVRWAGLARGDGTRRQRSFWRQRIRVAWIFALLVASASVADLFYICSHGAYMHMVSRRDWDNNIDLSLDCIYWMYSGILMHSGYDGPLPQTLPDLVAEGCLDAEFLENPRWPACGPGYVYVRPTESLTPSGVGAAGDIILIYEPYERWPESGIAVGFLDGDVRLVADEDEFKRMLATSQPGPP